jgi:enediyne biosynthesis protein CalE5
MATQDGTAAADGVRDLVHAMWASVAPQWGEHADYVDARGADITAAMLDRTAPGPGDRVLELACGAGGAGMAAAGRVGPDGEVVLSDVAAEMAAIAGARATARGLANVRTATRDLERIDEPDGAYDVVLCREGLMFAVEPERAAAEIARVLRPGGGRVAVAVWSRIEDNPWMGVVFDAVGAQLGTPFPPPGVPGPFSLGDPDRLATLLAGAGLAGVTVESVAAPVRASSVAEWWARTIAIAGPLATIVAGLPEADRAALADRAAAGVAPWTTPDGVDIPGVSLLASAHRP